MTAGPNTSRRRHRQETPLLQSTHCLTVRSTLTHLVVVKDGQLEEALPARGHLALAVHEPGPCQEARQIGPPAHDLVVHADAAAPAAEAALLRIAQAQQRCSSALIQRVCEV